MEYNNYKVDRTKSEDGVWMEYDGAQFKIARFGNPQFVKYAEALRRPYQRQIDNGTLSVEKQTELGAKAMARYILLGWEGFTVDGKEVKYSEDKALELLSHPDADEFRNVISSLSQDVEAFREDKVSQTEKKSLTG